MRLLFSLPIGGGRGEVLYIPIGRGEVLYIPIGRGETTSSYSGGKRGAISSYRR
jgi:hypothetical protein